MPARADIGIYQGDDWGAFVTVLDAAGMNKDLTGYTAVAQVRRQVADKDPLIVAELTIAIQTAAPQISLSLTHDQTAPLSESYVWDLELTAPDGIVTTILAGAVRVIPEVTRTGDAAAVAALAEQVRALRRR